MVGVGQSMYEVEQYTDVNNRGTAVLLEEVTRSGRSIEKLIVASSMSLYGEGRYRDREGSIVDGQERPLEQLKSSDWEVRSRDGSVLEPVPTPESKSPSLSSIYALSKFDQEKMCLMLGRAYGIPTAAMRFFNVFGTRQALSNPYTGVLAIFAARLMNDRPPMIFEDGLQMRDFVSVKDIALACRLALENQDVKDEVFNIGSGRSYTVRDVAEQVANSMGKDIEPEITEQYRVGDIRHCFADISKAEDLLGYRPEFTLETGLGELTEWIGGQIAVDRVAEARNELLARGLAV